MKIGAHELNLATLGRQLLLRREPLGWSTRSVAWSPCRRRRPLMAIWDSIPLAYVDRSRVIPPDYRKLVTRMNGDVLPTLLVDGYVTGVWRPVVGGIEATAFSGLPDEAWDGLAAGARALVALLADREPRVYDRVTMRLRSAFDAPLGRCGLGGDPTAASAVGRHRFRGGGAGHSAEFPDQVSGLSWQASPSVQCSQTGHAGRRRCRR